MSVAALSKVYNFANKGRKAGSGGFKEWLLNAIKYGATGNENAKGMELAAGLGIRLVPDAIGGVMVGANTPGDLGDKIIAGGTDALLGSIGGVGLSGGLRGITGKSQLASIATDMIGSYGGFTAAMPISDGILRAKDKLQGGEGLSPYEKLDDQRKKDIEMNLLAQLGLV